MKDKSFLIRCEEEDQRLIRWGTTHTKLELSEVVRQGLRIGIPMLVRRLKSTNARTGEVAALRKRFKRPMKMAEVLKATEESH